MPGEFKAWLNAYPAVRTKCRPVFEVVSKHGDDADLVNLRRRLLASSAGAAVGLDASDMDLSRPVGTTGQRPIRWLADQLAGVPLQPVMRISYADAALRDVGNAARTHGVGAFLRMPVAELPATGLDAAVQRTLAGSGLDPSEVDLLLDGGAVDTAARFTTVETQLGSVVPWALGYPWRRIIATSGAFPASISNLPKGGPTLLPRRDADLFDRVAAIAAGSGRDVTYGDYGVNHPGPPGPGRGPLPNLRYAHDRAWAVFREERALPGNQSFFTLAGRVINSPHWPARSCCWGDMELVRCAASTGGPGGATEWRAYSTSHHISAVTQRLASLGVP